MKHRLVVVLASVTLASAFSYQVIAQEASDPTVVRETGEKGGINLNRFRDDPGDPLELMNTDEPVGEVTADEREDALRERESPTYQLYDPEKSDLGPEAYRMDPSMRD